MKLIDKFTKFFHSYISKKNLTSLSVYKPDLCHFCILLFLSIIAYLGILRSPYFYYDDAVRVFTHTNINQGVHGRPLADLVYSLLSGGQFIDISPLSQICALALLLISGMMVIRAFYINTNKKIITSLLPLLFTVFPLNYSIISYRYDSTGMCLSIFSASLAFFLTHKKSNIWQICASSFLLFFTLSLYQPMIGIYSCLCCAYAAHTSISDPWKTIAKRLVVQIFAACCAAIMYIPIYIQSRYASSYKFSSLSHHPHSYSHGDIVYSNILNNVYDNIITFIDTSVNYISTDIVSICIVIVLGLFLISLLKINISLYRKILSLIFMSLSFLLCNTANYILQSGLIIPRTIIPISIFILCIFIFILCYCKPLYYFLILINIICILGSSSILTAIGNAQRDQYMFESKMITYQLIDDLKEVYKKQGKFSFIILNQAPDCYTLHTLMKKYKYIHSLSSSTFMGMEIMTYLPIDYNLYADIEDTSYRQHVSTLPTVIDRTSYSIVHDKLNNTYSILLKNNYRPVSVPRYESEAPLFFLEKN